MRRISNSLFTLLVGVSSMGLAASVAGCAVGGKTVMTPVPAGTQAAAWNDAAPVCEVKIKESSKRVVATNTGFKVTENIQFADNKADILPASEGLLLEVAGVIIDNPSLLNIYIAGFASSEGSEKLNADLSVARANSVKAWLIAHGIDNARISAGGYGAANPVADNSTKEGRELNRRVEFIAIKYVHDGKSYENTIPPGAITSN